MGFSNTDNFEPSVPLSFPQVGFFPSECVELINEKLQQSVSAPVSKQGTTHSVFYLEIRRVMEVEMTFIVSLTKLIEKRTSRRLLRKCSVIYDLYFLLLDQCFNTHHLVVYCNMVCDQEGGGQSRRTINVTLIAK